MSEGQRTHVMSGMNWSLAVATSLPSAGHPPNLPAGWSVYPALEPNGGWSKKDEVRGPNISGPRKV
jgi:hypothetical protein